MTRLKQEHCFCEFLQHELWGPRVYKHRLLHTLEPKPCANFRKDRRTAKAVSTQALWITVIAEERSGKTKDEIKSFSPFVRVLRNTDVYDWLVTLDLCDEQLMASVEGRISFGRPKQWETALVAKGCDPEFIHRLDALILPELSRWCRFEDTTAFSVLHRIFTFPKRLNLEIEDLRSTAFEKWLAIEKRDVTLPDISEVKAVIDEWFPKARSDEFYAHFVPSHGPGAVMEGTGRGTLVEKQFALGLSQRQTYFIKKHHLEDVVGLNSSFAHAMVDYTPYRSNETCKVVFVPKSWKTFRTISKEPVTTMWLQQGVGRCLDHWIKHNKSGLSYWYRLDTSDVNKWLASEGAIDGIYDTWDLSAASDTVLLELVKRLFHDTFLYDALICLRSDYVHVEMSDTKSIINLTLKQKKYAPMGSRLCFPVETIIFAAVCEAVVRRKTRLTRHMGRLQWPLGAVFGDDIVILAIYSKEICELLRALGFLVNEEKSFTSCSRLSRRFRESCGGEYIDNKDITPLRIPRRFAGLWYKPDSMNPASVPKAIGGLMALANRFYDYGYRTGRLLIIRYLLSDLKIEPLFTTDGKNGLKIDEPEAVSPDAVYYDAEFQQLVVKRWGMTVKNHSLADESDWLEPPHRLDGWVGESQLYLWLSMSGQKAKKADGSPRPAFFPEDTKKLQISEFEMRREFAARSRYYICSKTEICGLSWISELELLDYARLASSTFKKRYIPLTALLK